MGSPKPFPVVRFSWNSWVNQSTCFSCKKKKETKTETYPKSKKLHFNLDFPFSTQFFPTCPQPNSSPPIFSSCILHLHTAPQSTLHCTLCSSALCQSEMIAPRHSSTQFSHGRCHGFWAQSTLPLNIVLYCIFSVYTICISTIRSSHMSRNTTY